MWERKQCARAGLSEAAVLELLTMDVRDMQRLATADPDPAKPDKTLAAEVKPCLPRLDAAVPPLQVPDLAQCAAIMELAFEEERTRGPQSAAARDLQTLAQVLASRARTAFITGGASGDGADAALEQARDAMRREAQNRPGGVNATARCSGRRRLAELRMLARAPDAKSHY